MKRFLSALVLGLSTLTINAAQIVPLENQKCYFPCEECEIRKVFAENNHLMINLKFREAMKFYAPEYTENDIETGEIITLKDIQDLLVFFDGIDMLKTPQTSVKGFYKILSAISSEKISKICGFSKEDADGIKMLKKLFSPDITLSKFVKMASALSNEKISPEEFAEMEKTDNTPEALKTLEEYRRNMVVEMQKDFDFHKMIKELQSDMKKEVESFSIKSIKVSGENAIVIYQSFNTEKNKFEETTCHMVKRNGKWLFFKERSKYIEKK